MILKATGGKFGQNIEQRFTRLNCSILLPLSFLLLSVLPEKNKSNLGDITFSQSGIKSIGEAPVQEVRYINGSRLRRLPSVIRDLLTAINESCYLKTLFGDKELTIYLNDVTLKSFKISASVQYAAYDSVFHVDLNSANWQATDLALATTLIHETMHCILLSIADRARMKEPEALSTVQNFEQYITGKSDFDYNFFGLMNRGEPGQHELMCLLLYPEMKRLLERFATLHNIIVSEQENVELLIWSGLQFTDAYKKLTEEKKQEIITAILTAKGIPVEGN